MVKPDGQRRKVEATKRPKKLFASAFASLPDPLVLVDRAQMVVGWNRAAERFYGWSGVEVIGGPFALIVPSGLEDLWRVADFVALPDREAQAFVGSCNTKDGRSLPVWMTVSPVTKDDGEVIAVAVTSRRADPESNPSDWAAAERFRSMFAADGFGVFCGVHDRVTEANATFLESIRAERSSLAAGLAVGTVFATQASNAGPLVDGPAREFEITREDGSRAHLFAAVVSYGTDAGWVGLALDLTERKAAERAVAHLALHDPVTGLPNRRVLLDAVEQALSRAGRRGRSVALLFCDVDHFKHINDTHGHRVGDVVLRTIARRIESVLRGDDTVARVGGDEFVVVLQELAEPIEAGRVAERARLAIAHPIHLENDQGTTFQVTASIGVAISSTSDDNGELLLRDADDAMYVAKQRGRDQIAFASDPSWHSQDG
jgi:diguanylate cyclase (GGDEF)-like protein/PAS domain S-box-containing protein